MTAESLIAPPYPHCREAMLWEILGLRFDALILGTNRTSPVFPGDDDPQTVHSGAFVGVECAACLSVMPSAWSSPRGELPAWQFRGMATSRAWRGRGIGLRLIAHVEAALVVPSGRPVVWLNSRETAVGFYNRAGFRLVSEKFEIENVGPHFRMIKEFAPEQPAGSAD